jgi:peptidyl-dipeptidase Dcp
LKKIDRILFCVLCMAPLCGFAQDTDNPFFAEWKTPYGVPPFEKILNKHYMPAFLEGMKQQKAEITAITSSKEIAGFNNTILLLDQSGELLRKVGQVFYSLNSANTSDSMQDIAKQLSPLTTQHSDDIYLNSKLFKRVKAVYNNRLNLKLDEIQKRLVEETYKDFVRSGANLDTASQSKLRKLNKEINMLQLQFGQNLLAENNRFKLVVDKKEDLAGLPDNLIESAAQTANADSSTKGKWVFTLQNPSVVPFLQFAENRALREKIYNAYINRGNNNNDKDNKAIIIKLVSLRLKKAKLLGYQSYADFALDDRMAKKPENVYSLLNQVWVPALSMAKKEATEMQEYIKSKGDTIELQAWDWRFYSEKVMKEKFELDEESLRPYFKLENVRDGIFYVAERLYGITFNEIKDAPKYQKDISLYQCNDVDGTVIGVVYFDFFPRAGKRGGAWCGNFRPQSYKNGNRIIPVVTIVCNFSSPSNDKPALLSPDEVETFFHEFGHALHGLFRDVKYNGVSGVPRDFVELPSQIMEHWVFEPEVLQQYARHYKSGEVIPRPLIDKIVESRKFGSGYRTTEYTAASILDMDYHTLKEVKDLDVLKFESNSMNRIGLIPQIPPRYRSTYFQHTMTGGYTAGYYSYLWAEVLDADAYQAFKETGDIFNKDVAARFRKFILEKGGTKEAMQLYIDFRGKEPTIDALLENRGLK